MPTVFIFESVELSNWGNYPKVKAEVHASIDELSPKFISRGLGRSYGDASLSDQIFDATELRKDLKLEEDLLIASAGYSLSEILDFIVPKGFFLPVCPGTKFVTLGGALAADIHGKNHHQRGSFGVHAEWFDLYEAGAGSIRCNRTQNSDLFHSTIGGMGLTGIILKMAIRLIPISSTFIQQERRSYNNLDEILNAFEKFSSSEYSVAWIDCLSKSNFGRSVLFLGEHSSEGKLNVPSRFKWTVPFYFPSFMLNKWSIRAFNWLYFHKNKKTEHALVDYDRFFFPLDSIHHWNRIYGRSGFTQYQFVVPFEGGKEAMKKIILEIQKSSYSPFLTVLKALGKANSNSALSFPIPGYTLALDFKIRPGLFEFLSQLDELVMEYGGRVYLAKDCRLSEDNFKKMYSADLGYFGNPECNSLLAKRIGLR